MYKKMYSICALIACTLMIGVPVYGMDYSYNGGENDNKETTRGQVDLGKDYYTKKPGSPIPTSCHREAFVTIDGTEKQRAIMGYRVSVTPPSPTPKRRSHRASSPVPFPRAVAGALTIVRSHFDDSASFSETLSGTSPSSGGASSGASSYYAAGSSHWHLWGGKDIKDDLHCG